MTRRTDGPSAAVRMRVMKRDRFICTYCGVPGAEAELEVDHIIAVANGGSHHISNLTTACRSCNQAKGVKNLKPNGHTPKSEARSPLIGLYFHTFAHFEEFEPGVLQYQAQVIGVDGELVLAQMFSALDGLPTNVQTFERQFMYSRNCKLYAEHGAWIAAAEARYYIEKPYFAKLAEDFESKLKERAP